MFSHAARADAGFGKLRFGRVLVAQAVENASHGLRTGHATSPSPHRGPVCNASVLPPKPWTPGGTPGSSVTHPAYVSPTTPTVQTQVGVAASQLRSPAAPRTLHVTPRGGSHHPEGCGGLASRGAWSRSVTPTRDSVRNSDTPPFVYSARCERALPATPRSETSGPPCSFASWQGGDLTPRSVVRRSLGTPLRCGISQTPQTPCEEVRRVRPSVSARGAPLDGFGKIASGCTTSTGRPLVLNIGNTYARADTPPRSRDSVQVEKARSRSAAPPCCDSLPSAGDEVYGVHRGATPSVMSASATLRSDADKEQRDTVCGIDFRSLQLWADKRDTQQIVDAARKRSGTQIRQAGSTETQSTNATPLLVTPAPSNLTDSSSSDEPLRTPSVVNASKGSRTGASVSHGENSSILRCRSSASSPDRSSLAFGEKLYDEDWWFSHLEERRRGGDPPDSMF